MFKVGIIGLGKMGQIRKRAIEKNNGQIISIYDIQQSEIDKKYRVSDSDNIFNNPKINIIFLCVPNYLNKQLTIKGLKSKKHIFCEKPPAFNLKELKEIMNIEKRSNKKLMYGFNHRHHDSIKYIKQIVSSGEMGKILWMRGRYGKNVNKSFFKSWRSDYKKSGGGILIDQGIHLLDLFLYLAGDFHKVQSFISNSYWKIDNVEDNAFIILKNKKNNITASLHSTMTQWRHLFSWEIFLEKGSIILNGIKTPSDSYGDEVLTISDRKQFREEKFTYKIDNSWDSEIKYFFNAIKNNENISIGNSNDALKLIKIIDEVYKQNGRLSLA
jgi:predicted dehydrogenase